MVSKDDNKLVIWPIYFDKSATRDDGRRVSKKFAVEKPSVEDIVKAAKSLGLKPVVENDKSYPAKSWKKDGRILIDKKDSKSKLLVQISKRL